MGLPLALQAHKNGDLEVALQHYQRALEQGVSSPVLYQNMGALLRKKGKSDEAMQIYNKGILQYPNHVGLLTNRGNLLHADFPASALCDLYAVVRLKIASGAPSSSYGGQLKSIIALHREMGLLSRAILIAKTALNLLGSDPMLLGQIIVIIDEINSSSSQILNFDPQELLDLLEKRIETCSPPQRGELRLHLASHDLSKGMLSRALERFESGLSSLSEEAPTSKEELQTRQKLIDVNSWNFGCGLLKAQQFERGWKMFEYGLRTPAEGSQRWQRALQKPFAASELPMWRGESLKGKRLLLLDEQAIGDVMMFLTMVSHLQKEAARVGIIINERLKDIYSRSFNGTLDVWTHSDARKKNVTQNDYDYQCPLGSIFQYRFCDVKCYSPISPIIKPDYGRREQLRKSYFEAGSLSVERLIGVSWQGGGKPGRIRQKSITPDLFSSCMQNIPGIRFVSLQYGNVESKVNSWRKSGIDIIHDTRVNALKDMNLWVDQVSACDAVISVANTTIHGAGGLGIPTLCLLSKQSDWRWFDDQRVTRSYWYPSVGIARESPERGWDSALAEAVEWVKSGNLIREGPTFS
ncbi:hypothetical protein N9S87_00460 [Synechococcus sp. AH-779-G23]|nr:hypothetical protein [Synechococcus sp. AH-779-G23]MDA9638937.1 hypothetical protein [Synechococcus sp. AH-779-G23]